MDSMDDELSTSACVHIAGTSLQGESNKWKEFRKLRVTASLFSKFKSSSMTAASIRSLLWQDLSSSDISGLKAIEWGRKHEETAFNVAQQQLGKLTKTGVFFARDLPYLGASPDGLSPGNFVVEIKAPWSLRDIHPEDFSSMTSQQKQNYCLEERNGCIQLKQNHPYYWQIMTQMRVCQVPCGYFVV